MFRYIIVFVYSLIQGVTEVLPISSSGHLALSNGVLSLDQVDLAIVTVFHVGSGLAIMWWFRHDLRVLWKRFNSSLKIIKHQGRSWNGKLAQLTPSQKEPYYLGLSLIPTAFSGLLLQVFANNTFTHALWPSFFLILNGLILILTASFTQSTKTVEDLNWKHYILIGIIHGLGVIPGVSRLGIVLCTSLWIGLGWFDSVRLSFLLSIPTILGAIIVQFLISNTIPVTFFELGLGIVFSFIFGLLGLRFLSRTLLERKSLTSFGLYCCMLGVFSFIYLRLYLELGF